MCCRGMKVCLSGLALLAMGFGAGLLSAEDKKGDRLFEMRVYTSPEGKFEELHQRFREHTNKLFVKHGMDLIGYWVPTEGAESKNTLIYILAYPDKASRDASWKAFLDDPDWKAAYKESQKNGTLVSKVESKFLAPTDYSPIR